MNATEENQRRERYRDIYRRIAERSNYRESGKPDLMLPAIQWKELFKMWGYEYE